MFDRQPQSWADGPVAGTFLHTENESVLGKTQAAFTTAFDQGYHCQRTAGYAWQ